MAGRSMEPRLPDGSITLFRRCKRVKRGDIVLVDHPEFGVVISKVSTVGRMGKVYLRGISRCSASRRRLGGVPMSTVRGILVMRLL